jgi:hypothetical protein
VTNDEPIVICSKKLVIYAARLFNGSCPFLAARLLLSTHPHAWERLTGRCGSASPQDRNRPACIAVLAVTRERPFGNPSPSQSIAPPEAGNRPRSRFISSEKSSVTEDLLKEDPMRMEALRTTLLAIGSVAWLTLVPGRIGAG